MRYFVEITYQQALNMEEEGYATVASGASGGAAHPDFYGDNCEWMLMKSKSLRESKGSTE